MDQITESFLQIVAGDIEKLLIEDQDNISFAYKNIQTGMKVSLGITFDPTAEGISVSYDLGYDLEPKPEPPEKHKVKYRHTINEGQVAMEFLGKETREGRMSITTPSGETIGELKKN
uniref:Uncharacterized protein n=1 Tax=viral metagenome TaxID=1070528 RepID=A0A6M3JCP5_9ZZZZ